MNRQNPLILFAALGGAVLVAGVALISILLFHSPWTSAGEPAPLTAEQRAEEERLADEIRSRDVRIAELELEVRALNRRLEDRFTASSKRDGDSTRQPVATATESPADPPRRSETISAGTAQWLRQHLPEKYADLTPEELTMLTELELQGEEFTDADLEQLAALTHLRRLSLRGSSITDAGLAYLGDQIEFLDLRGTEVTGAGLQHLPTWQLEALHLSHTQVKGNDLFLLPPMPNLSTLKLNSLELDDSAIEAIGTYPSVRHLEVDSTGLTDEGLERLLQLNPHLTRIELRGTAVTAEGLARIKETHPACELVSDSGNPFAVYR